MSHRPTFIKNSYTIGSSVAELMLNDNWDQDVINEWVKEEISNSMIKININHWSKDNWIKINGTNDLSLNQYIYNSLLRSSKETGEEEERWKILWKLPITHKIKIFGKKLLHTNYPL